MACCKAPKLIFDDREGLECCTNCGKVLSLTIFDESAEYYTAQDNSDIRTTRLGPLMDPTDSLEALETVPSLESTLPKWSKFPSANNRKMRLLECYDQLSSVFREANVPESLLPDAKVVLRKAFVGKLTIGRSREVILLTSITLAGKMNGINIKLKKGALFLNVDWNQLKKCILRLEPELLGLKGYELLVNISVYLYRSLQLSKKIKNVCLFLCAREASKAEGREVVMAGTFVYLVTRYSHTFEWIRFCDVCKFIDAKASEVKTMYLNVVKNRRQLLTPIIPPDILNLKKLP